MGRPPTEPRSEVGHLVHNHSEEKLGSQARDAQELGISNSDFAKMKTVGGKPFTLSQMQKLVAVWGLSKEERCEFYRAAQSSYEYVEEAPNVSEEVEKYCKGSTDSVKRTISKQEQEKRREDYLTKITVRITEVLSQPEAESVIKALKITVEKKFKITLTSPKDIARFLVRSKGPKKQAVKVDSMIMDVLAQPLSKDSFQDISQQAAYEIRGIFEKLLGLLVQQWVVDGGITSYSDLPEVFSLAVMTHGGVGICISSRYDYREEFTYGSTPHDAHSQPKRGPLDLQSRWGIRSDVEASVKENIDEKIERILVALWINIFGDEPREIHALNESERATLKRSLLNEQKIGNPRRFIASMTSSKMMQLSFEECARAIREILSGEELRIVGFGDVSSDEDRLILNEEDIVTDVHYFIKKLGDHDILSLYPNT